MSNKTITLKPDHRFFFWWYLIGVLLTPLFGIGLLLIWLAYKRRSTTTILISDRDISLTFGDKKKNVPIAEITRSEVRHRWIDQRFGIGTVVLFTGNDSVELVGIENPETIASLVLKAAAAERKRLEPKPVKREAPPAHPPGSLDKLDYLTGLWQQGLLSDEDYEKERKHFEN